MNNSSTSKTQKGYFDDIDKRIMNLAKYTFDGLIITGIILFLWGLIKILDAGLGDFFDYTYENCLMNGARYDDYIQGYRGRKLIKEGIITALSCVSAYPLYGFGFLIKTQREIRNELIKLNSGNNTENYTDISSELDNISLPKL